MQKQPQQIELNKIANILNGSNTYHDKTIEQRIINTNWLETSSDININKHDLCRALSFKGNIAGFVGSAAMDKNIHEDIVANIGIKSFQEAKSVLIVFMFNEKASVFKWLTSFMTEFDSLISQKCEVVYGTETNNSLNENTIAYKILITGIETTQINLSELELDYKKTLTNSKELERDYERLLKEFKKLKSLNERLELSLLSLRN